MKTFVILGRTGFKNRVYAARTTCAGISEHPTSSASSRSGKHVLLLHASISVYSAADALTRRGLGMRRGHSALEPMRSNDQPAAPRYLTSASDEPYS